MGECSSAAAKTSVWWDIDKCAVPRGRGDPHRIAYNIIAALAAAGYAGPVSIAAYGDAARVAPPVLHALSATGICLTHVPAGSKDTSDKRMLVDMLFWAFDNPPPGNFLLISGDRDFSDLLHRLRMKRYNILLVRPSNASSQVLAAAAKMVWLWENIAAGDALRPESPPKSSVLGCKLDVRNPSGVLDCKPNVNNSDPLKCPQNKILRENGKCDDNVKASSQCRVKPLQKYVKKASSASSPMGNQHQVESIGGTSESSTGSRTSELDQSSVPSSSSSSNLLESMNTSVLLDTPLLSMTSAQKHVQSSQPQQVEATDIVIYGEKLSTSTECVARNGTLDFGGSRKQYNQTDQNQNDLRSEFRLGDNNEKASHRHRVKPLQKYVKKTDTTFCSASNQQDSVRVPGCPKGGTRSEVDQTSVSSSSRSSSSKTPTIARANNLGQPEASTLSHSSDKRFVASAHMHQVRTPHESILVKKPSISVKQASRNGTHGFNVSTVHYHPASQQSRSSEAQIKIHSNLGVKNGNLGNERKLNQQVYVKKVDVLSTSACNVIAPVDEYPDNPRGNTSSHSSQSLSASSGSKTLHSEKLNQSTLNSDPPFSLSSAHKPIITDHLHPDCAGSIFGKKDSTSVQHAYQNGTSVQHTYQNGTFTFGVNNGYCHPTDQQSKSSLPAEQNLSTTTHSHSVFGHYHSINSEMESSARPLAGHNGVSSAQMLASPSGSTFQGLDDICSGISRLNISECSRGTGEVKPLFQGAPTIDPSMGMTDSSGHSTETRSSFHSGSNNRCYLNQSSDPQAGQSQSSDYTCRGVHSSNLPSDMKNPGQHGEKSGTLPNSLDPEGTIGHILQALDILKAEKIFPTESNITDCIRYGEMSLTEFDVKKALELAIRHQAVVMKKLVNDMPLFVPKDESLWKCVNVTNSKSKNPIEALDTVQKYISSSDGYLAIKNSQSRYQAATILKESCLQHYVLGDVLQVLHIVIVRKKWLMPHSSGWQPLSLNTTAVIAPTGATRKA